jgi:hypothetical protein
MQTKYARALFLQKARSDYPSKALRNVCLLITVTDICILLKLLAKEKHSSSSIPDESWQIIWLHLDDSNQARFFPFKKKF